MKTIRKGSRGDEVKALQERLNLYPDGIFGALTDEAVREFQGRYGLVVDGIVGAATWAALGISGDGSVSPVAVRKSRRTITEIIVHCTATPEGRPVTTEEITKWHKQRGFTTIGYHYVVYLDGSIHTGRDVNVSGAHCLNHNSHSIGVCYVGGYEKDGKTPKDTRTQKQKESLLRLIKSLKQTYPGATVHGHCEYAAKACPCFDARKEYS